MKKFCVWGVLGACGVTLSTTASAQTRYRITDLGLISGGTWYQPQAINDLGDIAGTAGIGMDSRAFRWTQAGGIVVINPLGTNTSSGAYGINNLGAIVGRSWSTPDDSRGFVASANTPQPMTVTTIGPWTAGNAISDSGEIVGYGMDSIGRTYAARWVGGVATVIGPVYSAATDINSSGKIAGYFGSGANRRGFVYENGTLTDIGVPPTSGYDTAATSAEALNSGGRVVGTTEYTLSGAPFYAGFDWNSQSGISDFGVESRTWDINDSGRPVGFGRLTTGAGVAVVWENGVRVNLNTRLDSSPGWSLSTAFAINNSGWIVGEGWKSGPRGWLAKPIPVTLAGTVDLSDFLGSYPAQTVSVELRQGPYSIESRSIALTGARGFSFTVERRGTFDILVKGSTFLRKKIANVTIGDAGVSGLVWTLTNGDVDGNNVVDSDDFDLLVANFGGAGTGDLNRDGTVNSDDFDIIVRSFGLIGD